MLPTSPINSRFQIKSALIGKPNWPPSVLQSHDVPTDALLCGRLVTASSLWVLPVGGYMLYPLKKQAKVKAMTMEEVVDQDGNGTRIKILTSSWDPWVVKILKT
jgi:hypothetical protein